ncbi:MAG: metal-dependent hydrolase [Gammaproteobacteria bacterium]|nr:metal-dependent hydrolase [Gammaproteobacteria bacterium]
MDPVSQGAVGAAFAQSAAKKENIILIGFIGFLAGLAPDLDVLIRSEDDPILFLEYHRQFSHSLFFIPIGSFFVALFIFPFVRGLMSLRMVYIASFLGYATHGLLDACTSYGTQLFWPFSDQRVTWNNISIVDPIFTVPIVILLAIAITKRKRIFSFIAIGWIIFYLSLGFIQYERTLSAAMDLANSRGHNAERMTLKPSFGNLILWKSIYQHEETYYVDAIRTVHSSTWCLGESIEMFDYQYHLPSLDKDSQQAKDIERFRWFSQDYLGYDDKNSLVTDIRYSMIPNQIAPMWGLVIDTEQSIDDHATWWTSRSLDQSQLDLFKEMLSGKKCEDFLMIEQ